jgi:two-component sensor histidine kinase
MKTYFFYGALLFLLCAHNGTAQNKVTPHLTASMMKEGLITMSFKDAWRYQQGDDRQWANPNFDDAAWHNIAPEGLRAHAMPDSLWHGYGWWRIHFTADSTFYSTISRLHFRGWGAAEVYLDGKKITNYGTFSTEAATEKNFIPRYVVDKSIRIEPAALHVLAIRYANHQAKNNQAILKHNAPYLGFTFGFANENKGAASERNYAYYIIAHSVVTAILLLLTLLHLLLFFKFPKDKSNLAIALVVCLFLMSAATNYAGLFMEVTAFSNTLLRGFINSACYGLGLVLLPYTLSLLFRLDRFQWTKHLLWMVLVRSLIYFFPIVPIIVCDSTFIVIILVSIGIVMYHAIKSKKPGVHYVTAGAIGTTIFIMIDRLYATNVIGLSDESFYTVLVFSFICFPVGLSVYITSRYGSLFSSMEREVSFRTFALNKSVEDLKSAQVLLAAKNAENELLLKEIHHRVKNNLEIVSSLLQLQTAQIEDPSIQSAMLASQNRVQSMGIIHQKLYQGEHLAAIEMQDYFVNLSESILDSFSAEGRIKIECNMPKLILDVDTAISIGLITNELITNSLKYAFTNKDKGEINISLTEEKNDQNTEGSLLLKISDDGIGKPIDGKAHGTGFGTQLINLLTVQLNGKLIYEVNNGTIISLAFKKPKARILE